MVNIVLAIFIMVSIASLKFIFKINFKETKALSQNKELEKITNKFSENIEIAKEMLEMLNNKNVKIEQAKDTSTSLYIAITNKISIADMKNNYARIQTIAHECLHSIQDKTLLLFNFIFSNINIIYFLVITLLTIFRIINNTMFYTAILLLLTLIGFSVRSFLEIDAMTKSRLLAEKYIEKKNLIDSKEKETLLKEYDKINKIGIPFTVYNLLVSGLIKILVYTIICIFI